DAGTLPGRDCACRDSPGRHLVHPRPGPGRLTTMNRGLASYVLAAPAGILLLGLLVGPLVLLLRASLYEPASGTGFFVPGSWTTANLANAPDDYGLSLLGFTLLFGVSVAGLTVAVTFPLALFIRALSPAWRRVAVTVVLLPKLASALVIVFGLQLLM